MQDEFSSSLDSPSGRAVTSAQSVWRLLRRRRELLARLRPPSAVVRMIVPTAVARHEAEIRSSADAVNAELSQIALILGCESVDKLSIRLAAISGAQEALAFLIADYRRRGLTTLVILALLFAYMAWGRTPPLLPEQLALLAAVLIGGVLATFIGAALAGAYAGALATVLGSTLAGRFVVGIIAIAMAGGTLGLLLWLITPLPLAAIALGVGFFACLMGPLLVGIREFI